MSLRCCLKKIKQTKKQTWTFWHPVSLWESVIPSPFTRKNTVQAYIPSSLRKTSGHSEADKWLFYCPAHGARGCSNVLPSHVFFFFVTQTPYCSGYKIILSALIRTKGFKQGYEFSLKLSQRVVFEVCAFAKQNSKNNSHHTSKWCFEFVEHLYFLSLCLTMTWL